MSYALRLRAAVLVATMTPLFLAQPARAQAPAAAPDEASTKKATAFFLKGSELFAANRFALALEQFRQSYAVVPSPNSHLYIARCLAALGEHRDAYAEFSKVIVEVDARGPADRTKYAQARAAAMQERDELAPKVALVTITPPTVKLDLTVKVGGEIIPPERWSSPIAVKPGLVPVEIQVGNQAVAAQSLTLSVGEKRTIVLDASPAVQAATGKTGGDKGGDGKSSGSSPLRLAAYGAGGVGVVGMVMFAVSGSMSNSTYSYLKSQCGEGPCPASQSDKISQGKTQQAVANAGLGIGLVGLAAGGTMFVLSMSSGKKDEAPKKAGVEPLVGPGYLGVSGRF